MYFSNNGVKNKRTESAKQKPKQKNDDYPLKFEIKIDEIESLKLLCATSGQ